MKYKQEELKQYIITGLRMFEEKLARWLLE